MSGIYIRSQKKEGLYFFNNSQGIRYSTWDGKERFFLSPLLEESARKTQAEKHYIFIYTDNGNRHELGEYESKERCIEVLDEIQKICGQYLYAAGSLGLMIGSEAIPPMAAVIPRVYQMPEK